jgi:hypothetical protein
MQTDGHPIHARFEPALLSPLLIIETGGTSDRAYTPWGNLIVFQPRFYHLEGRGFQSVDPPLPRWCQLHLRVQIGHPSLLNSPTTARSHYDRNYLVAIGSQSCCGSPGILKAKAQYVQHQLMDPFRTRIFPDQPSNPLSRCISLPGGWPSSL